MDISREHQFEAKTAAKEIARFLKESQEQCSIKIDVDTQHEIEDVTKKIVEGLNDALSEL